MITLQQSPILAFLLGALALGMNPPAQAQSAGSDGMPVPIETVRIARASAARATTVEAFDRAIEDYERCHWLLAFEQLVFLANQGHADATRMAMQMHQYGRGLYGQAFMLLPSQMERFARARWQAQVTQPTNAR